MTTPENNWEEYEYFRLPPGAEQVHGIRNGFTLKAEAVNILNLLTTQREAIAREVKKKGKEGREISKAFTRDDYQEKLWSEGYEYAIDEVLAIINRNKD